VKFLRFGKWKIEEVGTGILALITNSRYLEGQVFNVMRESLRKTFDKIYIVNLRGDMRKKESGNPFDIRVGVSIAFMVRTNNKPNKKADVFYMDIPHSSREEKFKVLSFGFKEGKFKLLTDTKKNYFVEIDTTYLDRFEQFIPIDKLFKSRPLSGIMAGRDRLVYDVDEEALKKKLKMFFNKEFDQLENLKIKTNDTKSWKKSEVFKGTNYKNVVESIKKINYRGWDFRYIAYDRILLEGHRMGYIDKITENNPALTVTKSSRKKRFETAFISEKLIEKCYMAVTDTSYAFLLKLDGKSNIIIPDLPYKSNHNQVFYYIYGVLYSPAYRERYDVYLRKSFPRIPFPKKEELFNSMGKIGKILADIHLLKLDISFNLKISEINPNKWIIGDYIYIKEEETLYFENPNKTEKKIEDLPWIRGITQEMWNYSLGRIRQIEQFLNSRQYNPSQKYNSLQRGLNHDELVYFLKMISAIEKTIEILPQLDEIYNKLDVLD